MSSLAIKMIARSDVGLVRAANEDFVVIGDLDSGEQLELGTVHSLELAPQSRGPLAVVCDGMGGGEHGAIASSVAAEVAWRELATETRAKERVVFARQIRRSVRAANVAVRERAKELGSQAMGTTAAVAGLAGGALVLGLVGDCRAYVFRRGALTQVTRDQSVVSALVSAGALTDEQARSSERRHMILQALGPQADVDVGLSLVEIRRDDIVLLSSDGLHGVLEERFLIIALEEHPTDLAKAMDRLFQLAAVAGAPDNVSAVLIEFSGDGVPACRDVDLEPRFTEIDPNEDGEAALMATSRVGRRLAHRAGIREKLTQPPIPATGTHAVVTVPIESSPRDSAEPMPGPAERHLLGLRSPGTWLWVVAAVLVAAALVFIFSL